MTHTTLIRERCGKYEIVSTPFKKIVIQSIAKSRMSRSVKMFSNLYAPDLVYWFT